ncbi:MAG: tetratricopeptide repeat protein [Acidobacteria bacterium]|nr:tetratricopeptide repeat protein [Acidobacteriota bacterium]
MFARFQSLGHGALLAWVVGLVGSPLVTATDQRPTPKRWTAPPAYQRAIQAVQDQRWQEAIGHVEESLLQAPPRPGDAQQAAAGYVPYLYMAYAYARLGRTDAAEAFYRLAQRFGGYERQPELQAYATFIEQSLKRPSETPENSSAPSIFYKDPETHQASMVCEVAPARDPYNLPWYFHYALGKELFERGQYQEALRSLRRALLLNPRPEAQARTYGMWHTEYRPYYYMTQAFLKLGQRDCAAQMARESLRFREIDPTDGLYPEWQQVLRSLGVER